MSLGFNGNKVRKEVFWCFGYLAVMYSGENYVCGVTQCISTKFQDIKYWNRPNRELS